MAGTITETAYKLGNIRRLVFDCTGDASDGSFPDTTITEKIDGFLLALETNPGATAPSANYDITIEDGEAVDVLTSLGANRHTSSTEYVNLVVDTYFHRPVSSSDSLTLKIANNSNTSATTKIILYYSVAVG